ncbi:sugar ABC transporter ATP-binding protein [Actinorugispora endophytica]|uniref:Monosaccharide ABC transporter ATP-binding protein (CUT2 family) n=1 Tax=Actinorugispora endophytica TaxID=1605990 RepID=A0A4R6UI49_9ACTN|nr:sugar ABC transporter ATP-binding protein [Actinorugispora endophytica]TDQ46570.1 monosaccharide ABC transporter ATP-binding protein (CUT2 family) [Actinorugispora endophytica]
MAHDKTAEDPSAVIPLVETLGLGRRFGSTVALRDVDLRVLPGQSHALVGRNGAGKSTLVSLLTGLASPDTGEVRFGGEAAPSVADRDAWRSRVACVYQKSTVIPELTVAENLFVNRQPLTRFGAIDWRRLRAESRELMEQWDVHVDIDRQVRDLTVEDRQMVEIARALSFGARFIILDEPTAQLDSAEIDRLFERMRALQESGVTFLFISHHLQEVYEVCQEVTVLRDARWILTAPVADLGKAELVKAMTGEAADLGAGVTAPRVADDAPAVLELSAFTGDGFNPVDLTVRAGEVVGLAGSSGSGKVELAESLVGLRAAKGGTLLLDGRSYRTGDVPAALAAGVGCVPRDRHHQGLVPGLSIAENGSMTIAGRLGPAGVIAPRALAGHGERAIADLDIRAEGPSQPVDALSGGNQQKVVMARALATDPRLLVLINPTAGVDVKSKESLLGVIDRVRETGAAVIVISDELDDLRRCDRVVVLFHGDTVAEHAAGWRDQDLVASIEGITA